MKTAFTALIKLHVFLCFLMFVPSAEAQSFEDFRAGQERGLSDFETEQREGRVMELETYEAFRVAEQVRFEAFRDEMMHRWGSFQQRTNRNWVEYLNDGSTRWNVDFESGDITLEILLEDDESSVDDETVRVRISEAVNTLAQSPGTNSELPGDDQPVLDRPVLEGQLDLADSNDLEQFLRDLALKAEIIQPEEGSESDVRIVQLNLQLVPDHLRKRAKAYREPLDEYASMYKLDPALLLAVIHTESYFNPLARSHANALGLMQVVPNSAGRDVYRALNNRDGVPTEGFLFEPGNNILFGSAYIDILRNRYITGVESDITHDFLVIAAYNTGAGNVARAYTGGTGIQAAVEKANTMSDEENFEFLIQNLPFAETRDYLQKITERRGSYTEWLNGIE